MSKVPLQTDHVRDHNRSLVYQALKRHHAHRFARADLSRLTNLSVPTVSTILQEFGRLGLVAEVGQSSPRGGRPAQLCRFDPDAYTLLSVDLSGPYYRAACVNLLGDIGERFLGPKHTPQQDEALFTWLTQLDAELRTRYRVAHLALAVPGVVEPVTGHILFAPALGWHHYPLAAQLQTRLGYSVTLENDVNALAVAELYNEHQQGRGNALYLSITSGIGLCLVINGQIYRGSTSAAGEIGYSTLGHLGTSTSAPVTLGQPGPLERHLLELSEAFCADGAIDLSGAAAQRAFAHFCDDLTVILQNALCLLNPERLVISWPHDPDERLRRHLEAHLRTPAPVEVTSASLRTDAALTGAAYLALETLEEELCSTPRELDPDDRPSKR